MSKELNKGDNWYKTMELATSEIYEEYKDIYFDNVSHQICTGVISEQCELYKKELAKENPDPIRLHFLHFPNTHFSFSMIERQKRLIDVISKSMYTEANSKHIEIITHNVKYKKKLLTEQLGMSIEVICVLVIIFGYLFLRFIFFPLIMLLIQ